MERVLVVMQATGAKTESLALAFGLGAVEGGANIRLRHLAGSTPAALEHQGYGRLAARDIEWAELIGLAVEAQEPAPELLAFLEQLKTDGNAASFAGKSVCVFGSSARTPAILLAETELSKIGFSLAGIALEATGDDPSVIKDFARSLALSL